MKLVTLNNKLNKATEVLSQINTDRQAIVRDIITEVIALRNEHEDVFNNKKTATKYIVSELLKNSADAYTKRAVKVAEVILIDGYSIKYNLLTLAQMEQLSKFSKSRVNKLFKIENEDKYIEEVKELIKKAKVEKTTKVFSPKKAKGL